MNREIMMEVLVFITIITVAVVAIIIQRMVFRLDAATAVKNTRDGMNVSMKIARKIEQRRGD